MTTSFTLNDIWQILGFIGIQYSLGRRGSYPYGLLLDFSLFKITAIVVISDVIQTVLLLNLLNYTRQKFKCFRPKNREKQEKEKKKKRKLGLLLEKYGSAGLIFIAALPYGGGALTGSIVAVSMKMNKKKAFVLIITGCIIGSLIYYLGFTGILSFFKQKNGN
jgi:uncharacterized membrane protein